MASARRATADSAADADSEEEGDDEEEVSSQPAPVPLTFQQAAEHIRALRDFGLFINQSQFTASICQAGELLETEQCRKANCPKHFLSEDFR